MRQASEPTVEEILESIKKVIARDNRVSAAGERRQRESDGVVALAEPAEIEDETDDVLDLAAEAAIDEEAEAAEERPLLTPDAQTSMRESLAALAFLAEPPAQPQIVRSGETSLEGMVRDLLRPALSDWLDRNLPPLVERMVAAEIARIVSKRS